MTRRFKYILVAILIAIVVFFVVYSWLFRTFFNPWQYLDMAYAFTGNDPTIVNREQPAFEIIFHQGRLAIHLTFRTTEDQERGPIGLYIDPLRKEVFDTDARQPAENSVSVAPTRTAASYTEPHTEPPPTSIQRVHTTAGAVG